MSEVEEKRSCQRCGKKLRVDNKHDECWACRTGHGKKPARESAAPSSPKTKAEPAQSNVEERFSIVTEALGLEEETVLAQLKAEWLSGLKEHVRLSP